MPLTTLVAPPGARIDRSRVNGDILFDSNRALVVASNNGGNPQALQNVGA